MLRVLLPLFALATLAHAAPVPLFDGKTLDGWEGNPKLWRVEDGEIRGGSLTEQVEHNDFLATKKSYANFDLRLKLRLTGTGFVNSGVQIRSIRVPGSPEMSGYQVDYGAGWYGKLYDESRRNKVVGEAANLAAATAAIVEGEWNEYRIRADGPRIQSWVNGVPALDYTEDDPKIAQDGRIGIQIHGGGKALVQVKDVTIEELPPTPGAPTWEKLKSGAALPEKKDSDARENAGAGVKPMKEGNAPGAEAKTPEEERALLKVPEGFEVDLVAAEDPANGIGKFVPIAFDQRGALWTTTALEYPVDGNENPAAADALYASKAKDKVLVYDRDPQSPTGYANKPRVFAEGLAIPLGVLPYKNGCYVQHGHDIAFLEDTDADGRADKRTVILTGFGVQDSHLFPHQFMRAPGGWIWMAQGAFNYGKVRQPGEAESEAVQFDQTRMAKFRPDGSGFTITSNGPCNIWGLVLNGEGEAFIQEANDFGYPVMPFHEFANYPGCSDSQWKSYAPEFPGTAPDFRMGGTGLSGLALTDKAGPFPEPWRDMMLVANPITNRIQAIKMHRDGPYWKLDKPVDFLVSEDPWFRPVAITIGPDGCLYIVDWYNKIISHNEVPRNHPDRDKTRGRIWRVKPTGAKPFDVPDFTKLSGDELIAKLGCESLAQSHLAWQAIGDRTHEVVYLSNTLIRLAVDQHQAPSRRIQAMWGIRELDGYPDYFVSSALCRDTNVNIRREAIRLLGLYTEDLETLRREDNPGVRAEMVKSLGEEFCGVQALVEASWESIPDVQKRFEQRFGSLIRLLTLVEEPLAEPAAPSTRDGKPIKVREAYDREFERYLVRMFLERHPDAVAKFLDTDDAAKLPVEARLLASLALEPKASAARVAKLLPQLQRPPGQEEVLRLAQFPEESGVGDALKAILANPATQTATLETLLEVRTKLDAAKLAPFLTEAARTLLASSDSGAIELGAKLAGGYQLEGAEPALATLVEQLAGRADLKSARPAAVPGNAVGTTAGQADLKSALQALRQLGSTRTDLFARLAIDAADPQIREDALAALAASPAPDAPQRVLALYPNLAPAERRAALEKLSATQPGARAIVAAATSGTLPKTDLDTATLDRLLAVLGDSNPALNALVDGLGTLFRPVLALDGSDNAFTETGITLHGPLTVETWVKLAPGISNSDGILGAPGQLDINFYDGRLRVYVFPPLRDVVVATKPITPDFWTHVAATRDAAGIWKIYIDGELNSTASQPAPGRLENLRVGWTAAKGGTNGALAECRIWSGERTAGEIRANFDRAIQGGAAFLPPSAAERQPGGVPPARTATGMSPLPVFSSANVWGRLAPGAAIAKTSDLPPVLTAGQAATLDAKFAKYTALAAQPGGDIERGKQAAAVCAACHLFGNAGGQIGPNLSGVGAMGAEAILRNILTPNAALESAYRICRIDQRDGSVLDAFFVSEDKEAVIIRLPGVADRRIAKKDIVRTQFLRRSLMPEGLLDTMTDEQARDLFAYLLSLK